MAQLIVMAKSLVITVHPPLNAINLELQRLKKVNQSGALFAILIQPNLISHFVGISFVMLVP